MSETCPNCKEEFERLGSHWSKGVCDHPNLTSKQKEITTGVLMGDGNIDGSGVNPRLRVKMITPEYLEYLECKFGVLGTGVKFDKTATESAKRNRESGNRPNADPNDYSDMYLWKTRRIPAFIKFREWYSSGRKVWPEKTELTPTVLKHWYCCDGSYHNCSYNNNIRICMLNEVKNTEKVRHYFKNVGLPTPKFNISKDSCVARFTQPESQELWDYMGEPLPGFEYKWPKGWS